MKGGYVICKEICAANPELAMPRSAGEALVKGHYLEMGFLRAPLPPPQTLLFM